MQLITNFVRIALLGALVLTPWFFGGVWARVQWLVMLLLAILLALELINRFSDEDRPNLLPTAWIPLLLGVLLGVYQLIPWSANWAPRLASGATQWRSEFATPVGETVAVDPSTEVDQPSDESPQTPADEASSPPRENRAKLGGPRSLYPVATREYLALLALGTAVLLVASLQLIDRQSVLWTFVGLSVCGALLAFFGLIQRLSWNGKFYWVFEPLYGGVESYGPFVNRNNAGGFLNLCLAAGIGLLVWVHWAYDPTEEGHRRSSRRRRSRQRSHRRYQSEVRDRSGRHREETRSKTTPDDSPAHDTTDEGMSPTADVVDVLAAEHAETKPGTPTETTDESIHAAFEQVRRESQNPPDTDNLPEGATLREVREPGRRRSHRSGSSSSHGSRSSSRSHRHGKRRSTFRELSEALTQYLSDVTATKLWAVVLVCFTAGGVLCTASRGSILAMFAAAIVTVAVLATQSQHRRYAIGLLVILTSGLLLMSWAGQTDFVRARFEQMFNEPQYETGRVPLWIESLHTLPQFWGSGTGLGTYQYVSERYRERYLRDVTHLHAENQFVQALVEGGVIALVLLLVEIILTVVAIVKLYRTGGRVNTSLALAGTFALTSQLVGGCFDFGLYIPSNMMVMAAICGLVIGRAALLSIWPAEILDRPRRSQTYRAESRRRSSSRQHSSSSSMLSDESSVVPGVAKSRRVSRSRQSRSLPKQVPSLAFTAPPSAVTTIIGILFLGCMFGSLEMSKAAKIEDALRAATLDEIMEMSDPKSVAAAMGPLKIALPQRWDDAAAHRRMAELRMQEYRAETYQRLFAESAQQAESLGESEPSADMERNEDLWNRASLTHLHATVRNLQLRNDQAALDALCNAVEHRGLLTSALDHLKMAIASAPTVSRVHYLMAEVAPAVAPNTNEELLLTRAQTLAPGDAHLWYLSGVLDLNSGRVDQACDAWQRCLQLADFLWRDVMDSARGRLTLRQILDEVIPADAGILLNVATTYLDGDDKAAARKVFLERAAESFDTTDLPPDQLAYVKARVLELLGRNKESLEQYAIATSRNRQQHQWRYQFARLLLEDQQFEAAWKEATDLVRANSKSTAYENLLKEVNSRRVRQDLPTAP